jgi:serine/threonine protein phosphatase PrpC
MAIIESAGITDIGQKRKGNEDAMLVADSMGLYVVADGMGGHQAGEVASKLVIDTMRDYFQTMHRSSKAELCGDIDHSLSQEANRLLASIHLSNHAVHRASLQQPSYRGMGSTVSAVYFTTDKTLVAANVGDSPIYLVRDGKITLLSVPHTLMAEQMALDPESGELLDGAYRHVLTRAMGAEASVRADIHELQYFENDILVISSDGLSDKAAPEEILEVVSRHGESERACQCLVDLANERGGDDNVTAIVLKVKTAGNHTGFVKRVLSQLKQRMVNLTCRR